MLPIPTALKQELEAPRRWELRLSGELMAELLFQGYETPWIEVSVRAFPVMQPFWRNFEDPDLWPDDDDSIDAMLSEIKRRGGFTLTPDGGVSTRAFTLVNLDERSANLRFSDP